jgi:hypothetical protein
VKIIPMKNFVLPLLASLVVSREMPTVRFLFPSSLICLLTFKLKWLKENLLGMNAGQRSSTEKKLPVLSAF